MNGQPFIQLGQGGAGRGGQPAGGNGAPRGGIPIPPPPPVGRGGPAQGAQRVVMPNQGQPMMNPQVVPVPPRNQIPPRYQQRLPVEISDIRRERMSESDIRDALSDFTVIRFEKVVDNNNDDRYYRHDHHDRHDRHKPKGDWKTVSRTVVPGSKEDHLRQIRRLDHSKRAKTALDKKKALNLDQQRQIEKAQEELAASEPDPRYHTVLAQIDQTLKPVDRSYYHDHRHYARRSSHHHHHHHHRMSGSHLHLRSKSRDREERGRSRDRKDRKRLMQRVSVTAYYKRCPRPEQNLRLLFREREQMMNTPSQQQQQYLQQQHHMQQQQQQQQQQRQQQQRQQQQQFQQQQQQFQQRQGFQGQGQRTAPGPPRGIAVGGGHNGGRGQPLRRRHGSDSSSSDSEWSSDDDGFWSAAEGSKTTRTSSSSNKSRRGAHGRGRYVEHQPGHFGVRPNAAIRHHSRQESNYPLPFAPVPPRPALIEAEIEAVKAHAFHAGRHEGRLEGRQEEKLENRLATEEAVAIAATAPYRSRPPPRVIQPDRRSSVRLVDPRDVGYDSEEVMLDRLVRLDIGDRRRESSRYDLDAALSERREYERRLREDELLEREERGRVRERDARDYMQRRESSPGPRFANPFTPRASRRNTVSYETPGRYYYP